MAFGLVIPAKQADAVYACLIRHHSLFIGVLGCIPVTTPFQEAFVQVVNDVGTGGFCGMDINEKPHILSLLRCSC